MNTRPSFIVSEIESDFEVAQMTFNEDELAFHLLKIENWIRIHYSDDALAAKLEEYGIFHNQQCLRLAKSSYSEKLLSRLRSMLFDCVTYSMSSKVIDSQNVGAKAYHDKVVSDLRAALYGNGNEKSSIRRRIELPTK